MIKFGTILCLLAVSAMSCIDMPDDEPTEQLEHPKQSESFSKEVSVTQFLAGCGDGIITGSEVCDDGNTSDGDWCASDCLSGIDTTGQVCSTQGVLDLIALVPSPPSGLSRRSGPTVDLPSGAFIQLCDPDGDGVILPIDSPITLRGNGTEFLIKQSVVEQSPTNKVDVFHINAYQRISNETRALHDPLSSSSSGQKRV